MRDRCLTLRFGWCVGILLLASTVSGQTIEPSFRSDIQKLLDITGSSKLGAQAVNLVSGQILEGLKNSQPAIPDRALEIVKQVLNEELAKGFEGPDGLNERLAVIYSKHFTQ